ncbi:MAG: DNA translocase FtsK [Oscillospiraceae bacterium]|jgi:DNA segregation ATPase FtsK/SpoIIIE-like protein|nr:DNA translocase FtsK [Oscillospiraceae bacterium]
MATAKGKRTGAKPAPKKTAGKAVGKAAPAKRKPAPRKGGKQAQMARRFNPAALGVPLLLAVLLLFVSLISPSNASALLWMRGWANASFGQLRFFALGFLALLGIRMVMGARWPHRFRSPLWMAGLVLLCIGTLMQILQKDAILRTIAADSKLIGDTYANFLHVSYRDSQNLPIGGGFVGALLGYWMGKSLDIVLSLLILSFIVIGLMLWMTRILFPGASERAGVAFGQWRADNAQRREEDRAAREAMAHQRPPIDGVLTPPPEELYAPEPVSYAPPKPMKPRKTEPLPAQAAPPRPALYIEDILPLAPAERPYTEEDVERVKFRDRPHRPAMEEVPDFLAKRRSRFDAPPVEEELPPWDDNLDDNIMEETPPEPAPEPEPVPLPPPRRRRRTPAETHAEPAPEVVSLPISPAMPADAQVLPDDPAAYRQPPFSLLTRDAGGHVDTREADAQGARQLEETLASFGVEAHVIKVVHGPAITRYEMQPGKGVQVGRIVRLVDDIALNMASMGIRIEAPIPGKAAIGIELANEKIQTVHLRDVLESDESLRHPSRIAIALGKNIEGKRIIADIAPMPHLLIAGATGSGKSVCINTLIVSIIYRATPEEVRLILVDPKKVELSVYNGIPHLLVPVVTDAKKAAGALNWAVMEMDERYRLFAEKRVRNIQGYNAHREPGTPLMPQIVVVIDELADLMLVAARDVEDSIQRLSQLARAAGIHLVIATQRPSVNVITGTIKANLPAQIAFAVSSQVDSRVILGGAGAEKLLGRGDMLYSPASGGKLLRVQGCFVSDDEVASVVEYVKERHETEYSQTVIDAMEAERDPEADAAMEEDLGEGDELYEQAVAMAVDSGQASISMLQRKLRIGYARAGRLIDQMAQKGVIGQAEGTKPREVLISREDMEILFGRRGE